MAPFAATYTHILHFAPDWLAGRGHRVQLMSQSTKIQARPCNTAPAASKAKYSNFKEDNLVNGCIAAMERQD
jgi:hypothetical protein